jgi:nucleoside-diphosphate-sugar epimerase
MRVFVTGATGFIGTAVVNELIEAGHQVTGLARSDASAAALMAVGAAVQRGDLTDLESLRAAAAASEGVVHTAFNNSGLQNGFAAVCLEDRNAIEAMAEALVGSDRPLVITSGTALLRPGHLATEDESYDTALPHAALRGESETTALAFVEKGVRVSIIRLPLSVHGVADKHGFIPSIVGFAQTARVSAYIGNGTNHWPAVHQLDAAHLYRLALESAPAGSRLHAIGDEGVEFKDIAAAIGSTFDLPVSSVEGEAAAAHFTWLTNFVALDSMASSAQTQALLGWTPVQPGLIADIEAGSYAPN